jgi:hypothetical protein
MFKLIIKILEIIKFTIEYIKFLYKVHKLKISVPNRCYPIIGHANCVIGLSEEGIFNIVHRE